MSSEVVKVPASCQGCGKTYRVPSADRTYKCGHCGGAVKAQSAAVGKSEDDRLPDCPKCHAINSHEAEFCTECGTAMRASAASLHAGAIEEHLEVAKAFKRAHQWINPVQILYLINVVEGFGMTALLILGIGTFDVSVGVELLCVAMGASIIAFGVSGALLVPHFPFTCSVVLASVNTVACAISVMVGNSWVVTTTIGLSVVILWASVVPMVKLSKLMRMYPDERWAHRIKGTERRRAELVGGNRATKSKQAELLETSKWRAMRNAGLATLAIYLVTGGVAWKRYSYTHATPFESTAKALEEIWRSSNIERLLVLLDPKVEGNDPEGLRAKLVHRKWDKKLPALTESTLEGEGEAIRQVLRLDVGDVNIRWKWSDGAWRIRIISLPAPTVTQFAEKIRETWNKSDLDGLAKLFRWDGIAKSRRYFTALVERKKWKDGLPPVNGFQEFPKGGNSTEIHFEMDGGTLIAQCEFNTNGEWNLVGLTFPRD